MGSSHLAYTGLMRFVRGINRISGVGWDAGLVEKPIPLETLTNRGFLS
jgi:hypothetical protein